MWQNTIKESFTGRQRSILFWSASDLWFGDAASKAWKKSSVVPPNVFTVKCPFLSSHRVFYICMLQAGKPPVLAVATTLEQMSHLVCMIPVVGVTSWSPSNTLVSWLMAPADAVACLCVCRGFKSCGFTCLHLRLVCLCACALVSAFLCTQKVYWFTQVGRSRAVKPDDYRISYCIYEKHYTVWWSQYEMGVATLDTNKASPSFSTSPLEPL